MPKCMSKAGFVAGLAIFMAVVWPCAMAQNPSGAEYPAPRYPKFPRVKSADELMDMARWVVHGRPRRAMTFAYGVKPGENVLMIIPSKFSPLVRDALAKAIREAGARLDIVELEGSYPSSTGRPSGSIGDGSTQATRLLEPPPSGEGTSQKIMALGKADRYDLVIEGWGGPQPVSNSRWEHIPWDVVEKFFSARFAPEINDLVNQKVWDVLKEARRVHITDPEGTDFSYSITPEQFKTYMEEWDDPIYRGQFDIIKRGHIGLTPTFLVVPDAKGVVAATINGNGVFAHTKVYFERGQVVRVEGGGRFGEAIQQVLKKYQNVQLPTFPRPGHLWLIEVALGTNPLVSRVPTVLEGEDNEWERNRSGVIHFGFGASYPPTGKYKKEYDEKAKAGNFNMGQFQMFSFFNTVDVETADGKTTRIVDKGHITALDDPEVRKVAAKYGKPDELVREAWIPAVPGINVKGDYLKDHAPFPERSVIKDIERLDEENSPK